MSGGEARAGLRAEDREQLDRLVRALGRQARVFAIVVCPEACRAAAQAYLEQGLAGGRVLWPMRARRAGEVPRVLASAIPADWVLSLEIDAADRDVVAAVNWHREKLGAHGPVLLWLDGDVALAAFRAAAPDAYSIRDTVAVVRGFAVPAPAVNAEMPDELRLALGRLERASDPLERAGALTYVARWYTRIDAWDQARAAAEQALELLAGQTGSLVRLYRSFGYRTLGIVDWELGRTAASWRAMRHAQEELAELDFPEADSLRQQIRGNLHTLYSWAVDACSLRGLDIDVESGAAQAEMLSEAMVHKKRWNLAAARQYSTMGSGSLLDRLSQAWIADVSGDIERRAGQLARAETLYREAMDRAAQAGAPRPNDYGGFHLTEVLMEQAELAAAADMLDVLDIEAPGARARVLSARSEIALAQGRIADAFDMLLEAAHHALDEGSERDALWSCDQLVDTVARVARAGRREHAPGERALTMLAQVQDTLVQATPDLAPPWYAILLPLYRAQVLAWAGEPAAEASLLAEPAWQLAISACRGLAPMAGRVLGDVQRRAGLAAEAEATLEQAEAVSQEQLHMLELARIRRLQVQLRVQAGDSQGARERLHALEAVARESGSPRLGAESLFFLALDLPATCTDPDVLPLLERASEAFLDMRLRDLHAWAVELTGDVLAARGHMDTAREHYLRASAANQRHGLLLRQPGLLAKLARLG